MTNDQINDLRKSFEEAIKLIKIGEGKINFSKSFDNTNRKATLYFKERAWHKMAALIREFDKEVAWHGVAKRGEDTSKDEYIIYDILVYPQEVTGATVNTDQVAYTSWIMGHNDDVFNNIRMQGHSHVNMSVSPSTVDLTHQDKILEQFEEDTFYIFLIWNKRNEHTIKIYDMAKNVLFENSDVSVKIIEDDTGIERFVQEAKGLVKDKTYPQYDYRGFYGYGGNKPSNYNGYSSNPVPASNNNGGIKPLNPVPSTANTPQTKKGKGKGKRSTKHDRKNKKNKQVSIFDDYYEDDYPYGDRHYRS